MSADEGVALRLAREVIRAREKPLPPAAERAASAAVLDWFGAAVGGSESEPVTLLRRTFVPPQDTTHGAGARLVGTGEAADVSTVALLNGVASHVLEMDDIYSPGLYHPGAPTVAAALAVAQQEGASGAALLRAVAVGYEVGDRIAAAVNPAHYQYWHTTGTVGCLGAAAAVAELRGLDAELMAHALTLAATMASGLQQSFRSDAMAKPLHSGHAARAGVTAALAAAAGFTGAPDALEGAAGFGEAMGEGGDWEQVVRPVGPEYLVERTSVKPYPCCGHTFAAIDGALALRAEPYGLGPGDIEAIEIETYRTATVVAGNPRPRTPFEARFSVPFVVATALLDGDVRLESFRPERLTDPAVTELLDRTALKDTPQFTTPFPQRRGARVTMRTHGGDQHSVTVPDRKGDPDNPLSESDLIRKFTGLSEPVLGSGCTAELAAQLSALPELADVRQLVCDRKESDR
ncbi:MmgE/PrpD family protein [Streptomyces sp. NPDC005356]|uniref:MmgE/PrpD family protein n=1 Tax=Streptomyces sp. NPDC005356 TaxID=3157167 RepID=UPI0033AA525C